MKTFLLKAKHFFKRNIYPITISLCTVLVLSIIAVSAYSTIKGNSGSIEAGNQVKPEINENINNGGDKKPTEKEEVIIFDLPYQNATISKEFSDKKLLYDATTKLWCTHLGIDFKAQEGIVAKAVYDGTVTKIESSMMNGTVVYLMVSKDLVVVYKGLSNDLKIKEGDKLKKGQDIGKISGMLAEKADGVHLHLELFKQDKVIDPTQYFSFNK